MPYSLFKLHFETSLHVGRDGGADSLSTSRMSVRSDTIFSALCCECARDGRLETLVSLAKGNGLLFSDALPYRGDELFLPKPVLYSENAEKGGGPDQKKLWKKIEYIPLSKFDDYLRGLAGEPVDPSDIEASFGVNTVFQRVAIKGMEEPLPYTVAAFRFFDDCGLYLIVYARNREAMSLFEDLLSSLGLTGMGGKRSSGLGKFNVQIEPVPRKLLDLLEDDGADYQMLLGTALPCDNELEKALSEGWYSLVRRGGFVYSDTYSERALKKRTMYMLSAGSCLKIRFCGDLYDVSVGGGHPVWRNGKSLFAGFSV